LSLPPQVASGGGPEVIPFLTVYAVLPSSLVFFALFTLASQRFSREALFNLTVVIFLGFFAVFGW
jgi:ATP:ADP antiporter, AAA family